MFDNRMPSLQLRRKQFTLKHRRNKVQYCASAFGHLWVALCPRLLFSVVYLYCNRADVRNYYAVPEYCVGASLMWVCWNLFILSISICALNHRYLACYLRTTARRESYKVCLNRETNYNLKHKRLARMLRGVLLCDRKRCFTPSFLAACLFIPRAFIRETMKGQRLKERKREK